MMTETFQPDAGQLPFSPFDITLNQILREIYIKRVTVWLMGPSDNSVLAQAGNSVWETALTLRFLSEASDIFEAADQEAELRARIRYKISIVARWLLSKRIDVSDDETSWERVTWDTCVTIQALVIILKKFPSSFSESETADIISVIRKGVRWLCRRFSEWEAHVKYPFGPADVAQIVIALLNLARHFPDLYEEARRYSPHAGDDVITEIVEYLLHKKTEKTLTIETSSGAEDVVSFWWDDYFSTTEVVEALALFHEYCLSLPSQAIEQHGPLLHSVKEALVRACTYFEHDQVDAMWGSHIDTINLPLSVGS